MGNAFSVVAQFEAAMAEYAGAPYAVAVDCCTNAIFLCCKWLRVGEVRIPAQTYASVPMAVIHAGGTATFEDRPWQGSYQLAPYALWDGAKRMRRSMYHSGLHCLSFHAKKRLAIGRGGMILTDDAAAVRWLRRVRYDGREGLPYAQERIDMLGWHCYMTPEQAAYVASWRQGT